MCSVDKRNNVYLSYLAKICLQIESVYLSSAKVDSSCATFDFLELTNCVLLCSCDLGWFVLLLFSLYLHNVYEL